MRRKIAVTVPEHLMKIVEEEVAAGKAASVSAYVSDAIAEYIERDELREVLDQMNRELGEPSEEDVTWARRVLGL
jgi:Arc/MetJ-type ribon-helix-helix transcriptional regulator